MGNQSLKNQQQLAENMIQSLYNRQNEIEYVDTQIKIHLEGLMNIGMFKEVIEPLMDIYTKKFIPLKENLVVGILSDISYVQQQEEQIGHSIKIIRKKS